MGRRLASACSAALLALLGLTACSEAPPADSGGVVADVPDVGDSGDLATHGNDPLPPPGPGEGPRTVREVAWPCLGNGTDGPRVQLLYVHAAGVGDLSALRPTFESIARKVQGAFAVSAEETGGFRVVRMVTDAACKLEVTDVVVSANALNSFSAMISELDAQGFNRTDRKYHAWVEANAYCGIGTVYEDDRPDNRNFNATGPSYARSDKGCWNYAEAHEIAHNLGAVQNSAPFSTGGLHSRDEYDVMSYADGGPTDDLVVRCEGQARDDLFDCKHDDYFHTAPAPGSYLDTHWNVARSPWLASASGSTTTLPPAPPTTTRPPTTTTKPPVGSVDTTTEVVFDDDRVFTGRATNVAATVTSSRGICPPTGTVAFYVSGKLKERVILGPANAGKATAHLSLTFSNPGRFTVRAEYLGSPFCDTSKDSVRKRVSN